MLACKTGQEIENEGSSRSDCCRVHSQLHRRNCSNTEPTEKRSVCQGERGRVPQASKTEALWKSFHCTEPLPEAVHDALVTSGHDGRKGIRLLVRIGVKCPLEQQGGSDSRRIRF